MARYVYIGPPEQRGIVPSWGFDDGVLTEDHVLSLLARGHLRDLRADPPQEGEAIAQLGAVVELAAGEDGSITSRIVAEAGSPEAEAFHAEFEPAKPARKAPARKPAAKPAARKAR